MKKNNFISLQCSSESFEKSIALYYSMNQQDFYNQYNVNVFYGHNLPKKNKKLDAIGTIGFYNKYYSKTDYFKHCSKKELIKNKKVILNYLLLNSVIVKKNYNTLLKSKNYWLFIKNLPFEYLFPNHSKRIIEIAQKELNIKLIPLYFEDNYLNSILKVDPENKFRYCIYSLEDYSLNEFELKEKLDNEYNDE